MRYYKVLLLSFFLTVLSFETSIAQWTFMGPTTGLKNIKCMATNGTNIFAGSFADGMYLSTDEGATWNSVNTGLSSNLINCVYINGSNIYAGTFSGAFLSTNNGSSWSAINTGLTTTNVTSFTSDGTDIYAGTSGGGVFRSTNNGANWTGSNTGITNNTINTLAYFGTTLFAGTQDGVFYSTNNGTSWNVPTQNPQSYYVKMFASSGSNLYAGTNAGVYRSTDNGVVWHKIYFVVEPNTYIGALITHGNSIFAGEDNGVYHSGDSTLTWTDVTNGFTSPNLRSFVIIGSNIYAASYGGGVWKRPIPEMVTSVRTVSDVVPSKFSLEQNYPNPFNPSTYIKFQLPNQGTVNLTIVNSAGQEIETLLNQEMQAGEYEIQWNAANLPSGVYYYHLTTEKFTSTKSMMLVK